MYNTSLLMLDDVKEKLTERPLSLGFLGVALAVWYNIRGATGLPPVPPAFAVGVASAVLTATLTSATRPVLKVLLKAYGFGGTALAFVTKILFTVFALTLLPKLLRPVFAPVSNYIWYVTRIVLGAAFVSVYVGLVVGVGIGGGYTLVAAFNLHNGAQAQAFFSDTRVWSAMLTILILDTPNVIKSIIKEL